MSNPTSPPSNNAAKRSATDDLDEQAKKMKIETPVLERKTPMNSAENNAPAKFVTASALMNVPIPEISDEELLAFTLEFERTHGIN
ncbi:unnamed protein product [Adineta ricciae]|uniref:Uncharacterized protein n=1 Tax=Adineta ricciae TaxID=249248 RepID=A0A814RA25_ADIRI|nr:unnamed protein product [Adineta ricciae]CAF1440782.1 unnamed protein product [Adineta ricciae]